MAGHPQAAKLKLTSNLPRSPGVYMFCGHRDEVLYVGKATNLRQRVRSYFGQEDRRRIGPMLREAQSVRHHCLPDPLSAEVVEARLIARLKPRYNRAGTRADRYCYVRLDVDSAWPRLAIVKDAARTGLHLGPLPSRTMADARHRGHAGRPPAPALLGAPRTAPPPPPDATPCAAAQMGVAACPCAGLADRRPLRRRRGARRRGDRAAGPTPSSSGSPTGCRPSPPRSATRRRRWPRPPVGAGGGDQAHPPDGRPPGARRFEITAATSRGSSTAPASSTSASPARPPAPCPPRRRPADPGRPLPRGLADEALVLARHLERLE